MRRGRSMFLVCIFFFFQAEDGIRDLTVTGVQTCALPISLELEDVAEPLDPGRIDQVLLGRLLLRGARLPPGGASEGDGEGDVLVNRVGDERRAVVMGFAKRGTRIHLGILA